MVNVKKRKGRVVIDSDSDDSVSDDNLDQVRKYYVSSHAFTIRSFFLCGGLGFAWVTLARASMLVVTALFRFLTYP